MVIIGGHYGLVSKSCKHVGLRDNPVAKDVFVLLGGITSQVLVKLLLDLDSWILSTKMSLSRILSTTRNLVWNRIKEDNPDSSSATSSSQTNPEVSLDLPVSTRNPRKVRTIL